MKKRLLAVLMALCITSLETMGAYAAVAENGETSQIAVEESEENTEDSVESAEDLSDSSEAQENNTENSGEDGQENVLDQNGENSQDEDSSEENTTESEDDSNQQDPNVEEEDEQEEVLSEASDEGITDEETAAIKEPKEADNAESSDAIMSGECGAEGDNLTWELSGSDTDLTLTIRGSGQMASYTTYPVLAPWHKSATNIKNIVLSEEMTSIGNEAFSFCRNMTSITIPEKVTSIGNGAFRGCSSLSSVTFSEGVMSIGNSSFFNCSSLTSVTIPEGVTSIGAYAFSGCSSLTSVTIPKEVASIGKEAFYSCQKLSEIYISSLESWLKLSVDSGDPYLAGEIYINGELLTNAIIPEGMTIIRNYAFAGCSSLTNVTIPEGVTSIGNYAFARCSNLTSVTIPEGVTSIGNSVFSRCSSLTSVTIPEGVTSIGGYAFSGCSSLTSVTIPEGVTSIGPSTFNECSGLTSVMIPEGVTSIEFSAFSGCSSLTSITIPEGVTSIGSSVFSRCSSLTSITIPEGVKSIKGGTFSGCSNLECITIPKGVKVIETNAFSLCFRLNEIHISSLESWLKLNVDSGNTYLAGKIYLNGELLTNATIPEGVTKIRDNAFFMCFNLVSVTMPEGVTSIGNNAFSCCSNLTSITMPEGVTSIGNNAFSYCSSLTSVTIPEGVTCIGTCTFKACTSLSDVIIPEGVTRIETNAFVECSKLNEIHISSLESWLKLNVDSGNDNLAGNIYLNGELLTDAIIPEGVTYLRNDAFRRCDSLASVTIPKGVTSIGRSAFYGCSNLSYIIIPEGVTDIGDNSFEWCKALNSVCIPYSTEEIGSNAFSNYSGKVYYWGTRDELEKIYNGDKEIELISIFLDKDMLNLENNQSTTLFITSNYEDIGNDIIWSSSDNEIVSVSETGIVTANNIGEAIITAATRWGDHTASCMVSVVVPVTGILLEQEQVELSSGSSKQLIAVIEPDDATNKEVTWTSSNPEIVSVDEDGIITAHNGGTATITAVTKDGQFSADCTVTVPVPVESVSLDKSEMLLKADEACSLNATVLPEDAAVKELIWTSSDESVVTVDDGGTVTAHRPGSAVITVTTVDGGKTDSCVITVPAPVPVSGVELEYDSITVDIDTEVELKAIVYPEDAANKNLIWSSSDESVASINSNGVLQAKEVGVAEITVRTEDGSYTATCQVSVIIPVSEIILDKYSIQLEKGQNEKITVEILPENAAETIITWKSSDTKVATVDETGVVTATGGGTAVITASTSNGKTAQCVVEVSFTYSSINYVLNGGDNNPDNPEQYNELGIPEFKEPTRSGYIFGGWYADEQLTEKVTGIEAGQTGDLTFYAKWTGKTYKIVFSGNGADSGKMSKISYTVGEATLLPGNTFKKKEYIFDGWNTKKNGEGIEFKNKASIDSYDATDGSTITFYAQWKIKEYSIIYKLSGGVNNKSNPATYNFKTAVTSLAKPTRKGYTFKGWFTDAKFKNQFKGIKKGSTGNKTVYAKWAAVKYTVSYVLNGGTAPKGNPANYYVTTATIKLKNPTKKNYTFGGWYKDAKFKTKITSIPKGSVGNLKLYAKWTPTKYKITYKLNGGTNNKLNPATYTVTTANITLAKPTRKGCVFSGWYSDSKFKNKVTVIKKGTTGNKTLYARWKIYEYSITYNLNGGKFPIGNPASYNVNTATIKLKDATKKGYVFAGWYKEATFKTKVTTIPKGSTGNLKLYAKWVTKEEKNIAEICEYVRKNGRTSGDDSILYIQKTDDDGGVTTNALLVSKEGNLGFGNTIQGANGSRTEVLLEYNSTKKEWSPIFIFIDYSNNSQLVCAASTNTSSFRKNHKLNAFIVSDTSGTTLSDEVKCQMAGLTAQLAVTDWLILLGPTTGKTFSDIGLWE